MVQPSETPASSDEGHKRPRVVMVVANNVTTDNRVIKTATTLSRAGAEVVVLGLAGDGVRTDTAMGDVRILRIPVPLRLKEYRQRGRARRRARRLVLLGWPDPKGNSVAKVRLLAASRETAGSGVRQRVNRGRRFAVRVRANLQRRIDRTVTFAWKGSDRVWSRTGLGVRWRRISPELRDFELAFGPVIDHLEPDVIHAHDYHMLNVASLASTRAALLGRRVPWIYDAHEFVPGMATYGGKTPRVIASYAQVEREYIRDADAVITVSPYIATKLQSRHRLPRTPAVVLNAPASTPLPEADVPDIRSAVGLGPDVPLLVYSGGVTPARGVDVIVRALPLLPDVHLAVVAVPSTKGRVVEALMATARSLGVERRVHLLEPVGTDAVTAFLRTADIGVHPLPGGFPNHDMALPNKLFEYLHAGLPLVVSDAKALSAFVLEQGVGASFTTGDPVTLARAVTEVLAGREAFVAQVVRQREESRYSWQGQEQALVGVYHDVLGLDLAVPAGVPFAVGPESTHSRDIHGVVLGVGPANSAGQGWAWAKAAERHLDGVRTEVVAVKHKTFDYPCDISVAKAVFARDASWQLGFSEHVLGTWTHALLESGRAVVGSLNGRDFSGDAEVLRASGISVGLVFHGSEMRNPRRHAASDPWSPFRDPREDLTGRLQRKYDELAPLVAAFDGPKFVSTPDQLDYVEDAIWLPVVVDTTTWLPAGDPLERVVPVVVHAPSSSALKGTAQIEAVLLPLAERGLIDYRRIEGLPPSQVGALLAEADIVVDQLVLGLYGVLACEAMALGRVVVSHVGDSLRSHVPAEIPILEATPGSLGEVMTRVLDDRPAARIAAVAGPEFVARFHDGRVSAQVLYENFLAPRD